MKKIFDSAYGKDIAALLVALGISLNMYGWVFSNLIFLVGPLIAFIPRVAFIYYSQKSPKEGEKAMIATMSFGYLFLAIGFMGEADAGLHKDVGSTLFVAGFYYMMVWSFASYGFWGEKKVAKQPRYMLALVVVALAFLIYEMFITEAYSKEWYEFAAFILIGLIGLARQFVLHNKSKYTIE